MATKLTSHACKACNSLSISSLNIPTLPISAQPFKAAPSDTLSFDTSIFLCEDCGHMFLDIPPVTYYKNVIRSVSVSSEMTEYRRKQFRTLVSLFSKPVSEIRVLEIGAGNGQYSQILSEFFPLCFATEANPTHISNSSVHFIDTHPDDDDFQQTLKDYGPFDLICCFSYLEHLPNPLHTLSQIEHLLAPGGYTLLEVPNSDYIREKGLLCEVIPDHLHYFTARSIVTLASHAQLNLQTLNSTWSSYILSCLFKKSEDSHLVVSRLSTHHQTLLDQIQDQVSCSSHDKKIAIWGAGHQSLFILASSVLYDRVDFIIDSSVSKQDKYIPGVNKVVSHPNVLLSEAVSLIFVMCAGYNSEVVSLIKDMHLPGPIQVFSVLDNQLNLEPI